MSVTISSNRTREILDRLEAGQIEGISLEEFMQVSFLSLMSGDEVHIEEKVMYGGNLFQLHACVNSVTPSQPISALRTKV